MKASSRAVVAQVRVTPIAFRDPPLLNVQGVHEPWALRSIIEIHLADGRVGLGESYGDLRTLADLNKIAPQLVGLDPFDLNGLGRLVYAAMGGNADPGAPFPPEGDKARASALAAFEVAMLDLQGQMLGRPLYELLGGAVRAAVPYSAYLFYKFARHHDKTYPADAWGEALTAQQMVEQQDLTIDAKMRTEVIESVLSNLNDSYVFADVDVKKDLLNPAFWYKLVFNKITKF